MFWENELYNEEEMTEMEKSHQEEIMNGYRDYEEMDAMLRPDLPF